MHIHRLSPAHTKVTRGRSSTRAGSPSYLYWQERAGGGRKNSRLWGLLSGASTGLQQRTESWATRPAPQASRMWLSELSLATSHKSPGLCSLSFEGSRAAEPDPNQDVRPRKPSERPGQLPWQTLKCPWSQDKQAGAFTAISKSHGHPAPGSWACPKVYELDPLPA